MTEIIPRICINSDIGRTDIYISNPHDHMRSKQQFILCSTRRLYGSLIT